VVPIGDHWKNQISSERDVSRPLLARAAATQRRITFLFESFLTALVMISVANALRDFLEK